MTINSFDRYAQVFFIKATFLKRPQKLRPPSGRYAQVWLYLESKISYLTN